MDDYDIMGWLRQQVGHDFVAVLMDGQERVARVERSLYGVKGGPARRKAGGADFVHDMKKVLFWLQSGHHPAGISPAMWAICREMCAVFVERGQWKPEALHEFDRV